MGISSHANTGTLGAGDQAGASRVGVYGKEWEGESHPFTWECHRTKDNGN